MGAEKNSVPLLVGPKNAVPVGTVVFVQLPAELKFPDPRMISRQVESWA